MTNLKAGDQAPDFSGTNEKGETVKLSDFRGSKLILFFYPKDNTPGCTKEACNLRDNYQDLKKKGFELLGVSPDSARKHTNFIKKFGFPFSLIADTDKKIANAYQVWGPKKIFGLEFNGIYRTTFIIDEKGTIEKVFTEVDTNAHAEQILEAMNLQ